MNRKELATMYHKRGCNCCQSVVLAFEEKTGLTPEEIQRMGEAFGLGMGGMQGTCGALSGAMMMAGLLMSDGDTEKPKTKKDTYKVAKAMFEEFQKRAGSTVCKELKGVETKKVLLPCQKCIELGIDLVEEFFDIKEEAPAE